MAIKSRFVRSEEGLLGSFNEVPNKHSQPAGGPQATVPLRETGRRRHEEPENITGIPLHVATNVCVYGNNLKLSTATKEKKHSDATENVFNCPIIGMTLL